ADAGLSIVDAHNPVAMRLVNQVGTSFLARSMRTRAGRLYVGEATDTPPTRPGNFEIFDVTTPGELNYAPISRVSGSASDTSTAADPSTGVAAAASGTDGVKVYDVAADVAAHPCLDGLDNDGDGLIDYPADPGCSGPNDDSEQPECSDGLDNDGDGLIDFPADPGCGSPPAKEAPQRQDG